MTKRALRLFLFALLLLGATACGAKSKSSKAAPDSYFDIRVGEQSLGIQLAITREEQTKGLMHRKSLDENHGMLFIYRSPQRVGFWMKNTTVPLHIGYFSEDGILKEIHPLYPLDLNTVESRSDKIQFALEVNQGWFSRNGVKTGDKINIKDIKDAMKARGYPPALLSNG